MKKKSLELVRNLEAISNQGVLLYREERLATPGEIAKEMCVCEDMDYMPEFIVIDEEGRLKEVWYGSHASCK